MKKYLLSALMLMGTTGAYADMYKHDLQVFTANTMEIPCKSKPKELFFGEYEKVMKLSNEDMQSVLNSGISQAGSNVGSWINMNGVSGADLAKNLGAGMIGNMLGKLTLKAVYAAMDDPEYLLISECNSGKNYTRLITMVVSDKELDLATAKKLAQEDQKKMARKVNR